MLLLVVQVLARYLLSAQWYLSSEHVGQAQEVVLIEVAELHLRCLWSYIPRYVLTVVDASDATERSQALETTTGLCVSSNDVTYVRHGVCLSFCVDPGGFVARAEKCTFVL